MSPLEIDAHAHGAQDEVVPGAAHDVLRGDRDADQTSLCIVCDLRNCRTCFDQRIGSREIERRRRRYPARADHPGEALDAAEAASGDSWAEAAILLPLSLLYSYVGRFADARAALQQSQRCCS